MSDIEDSDGGDESPDIPSIKRTKLNEDCKTLKCRERNRIHARNTRERKRIQMDMMHKRIEQLYEEKAILSKQLVDTTVAGILITLSSKNDPSSSQDSGKSPVDDCPFNNIKIDGMRSLEEIKARISLELTDNDDLEFDADLLNKDKSACTSEELDTIRRERNRMHAKKTRLRKKKMLQEMESILATLETEVMDLRSRVQLFLQSKHDNKEDILIPMTMEIDKNIQNNNIKESDIRINIPLSLPYGVYMYDDITHNNIISMNNPNVAQSFANYPHHYTHPYGIIANGYSPCDTYNDMLNNGRNLSPCDYNISLHHAHASKSPIPWPMYSMNGIHVNHTHISNTNSTQQHLIPIQTTLINNNNKSYTSKFDERNNHYTSHHNNHHKKGHINKESETTSTSTECDERSDSKRTAGLSLSTSESSDSLFESDVKASSLLEILRNCRESSLV